MTAPAPEGSEVPAPPSISASRWRTARICFLIMILGFVLSVWKGPRGKTEASKDLTGSAASITIKNFEFTPAMLTIEAGATVRWTNADVANHQITTGVVEGNQPRPDGRVSSPLLFRGDEFSTTFRTPGEYPYYCGIHPFMRGTVGVK